MNIKEGKGGGGILRCGKNKTQKHKMLDTCRSTFTNDGEVKARWHSLNEHVADILDFGTGGSIP